MGREVSELIEMKVTLYFEFARFTGQNHGLQRSFAGRAMKVTSGLIYTHIKNIVYILKIVNINFNILKFRPDRRPQSLVFELG